MPISTYIPKATCLAATLALAVPAAAETTLEVMHAWPGHARFHEPLARAFEAANPGVTVEFRVPPPNYQEAHLALTRGAITGDLPDIYFAGFSVVRPMVELLSERGQAVALDPFMEAEGPDWIAANYNDALLSLGQVDGVTYAIPFNASTPILYVNADLVREAGHDPADFPGDWDGIVAIAQDVGALSDDIDGMDFSVGSIPGDWFWQATIQSLGGEMLNADETGAGYDNAIGVQALTLLRRLAEETEMNVSTTPDPYRQQFFAGNLGMFIASPSAVANFTEAVGGRFELMTARFPVSGPDASLPTGGNAVAVTAQDAEMQALAWDYAKFVTSAEAQADIVQVTGYMPTNLGAADALTDFFAENPTYATVVGQMQLAAPWYGYPGGNSVEIWRAQREIIDQVQRGTVSPEDGLAEIVAVTADMIN